MSKIDLEVLKTITILYVEDDKIIQEQTTGIFKNLFKEVYVGKNGKEGLDLYKEYIDNIDIVVTDINMPLLNGLDMAKAIHDIKPKFPIILTTAHTDEEFLLKSMELDISKFLAKPLKIKELAATIALEVAKYKKLMGNEVAAKILVQKNAEFINAKNKMQETHTYALQELEFYKSIIDFHILSLKLDKQGNITDASTNLCEIFEYSKDELLTKNISIICQEPSLFTKNILISTREGKSQPFVNLFTSKSQKDIKLKATIYPVKNIEGFITEYLCYMSIVL